MKIKIIGIIILLTFIATGYYYIRFVLFDRPGFVLDNDAPPGCSKTNAIGGCFSKNTIRNFQVVGELPSCLTIRPHVCVIAGLVVENVCPEGTDVYIEGTKLTDMYAYPTYGLTQSGKVAPEPDTAPYPTSDQNIILNGSVNGNTFTINYTRTKALCD